MLTTRRFLIAALLGAAALNAGEHTGRRAPGFSLPDSKMKMHDLADYRGKPLILEFLQTECPHCADFARTLARIQQKYGNRVGILAVVNAQQDNAQKVAKYVAGHKITYPVLFDQGQMEYSYLLKTTVQNPCVFLIDANGVIRNNWEYSAFTESIFEGNGLFTEIDRMLTPAPAAPSTKKK